VLLKSAGQYEGGEDDWAEKTVHDHNLVEPQNAFVTCRGTQKCLSFPSKEKRRVGQLAAEERGVVRKKEGMEKLPRRAKGT